MSMNTLKKNKQKKNGDFVKISILDHHILNQNITEKTFFTEKSSTTVIKY